MTQIYFVRHAQPAHSWENDKTRPLTDEGIEDSKQVTDYLKDIAVDLYISSPYKRSIATIMGSANNHNMTITTDDRLRERTKGTDGNNLGMFQKRWSDMDFHENGGESINMVQKRNIEVLLKLLTDYKDKTIVIGTHGTALSSIFNYFDPSFGCDDFLRIIDFMPYVALMTFDGLKLICKKEMLIVKKEFNGNSRADKAKLI